MVVGKGLMINENARTANGWIDTEETAISRIMAEDGCARLEAIRIMRRAETAGPILIPKMNVSREADAEFMRLLQHEHPERYARLHRNMRKDSPNAGMTEEQAISNFILGLSTAGFHFAIVAGRGAPVNPEREIADRLLRDGTDEEWVQAIMALADAPEPRYPSPSAATQIVSAPAPKLTSKKGGRPKLTRSQKANSQSRRRAKVRVNVMRFRDVLGNQKTPSQSIDYAADTTAIFASV
jgi:hypothetical protein